MKISFFYPFMWILFTVPLRLTFNHVDPTISFPTTPYLSSPSSSCEAFHHSKSGPSDTSPTPLAFFLHLFVLHLPPDIWQLPKVYLIPGFLGENGKSDRYQSQEMLFKSMFHYLLAECPCDITDFLWTCVFAGKVDHTTCFSGDLCASFLTHSLTRSRL